MGPLAIPVPLARFAEPPDGIDATVFDSWPADNLDIDGLYPVAIDIEKAKQVWRDAVDALEHYPHVYVPLP